MSVSPPSPPPETIEHQLPCVRCGYALIGLPRGGACPECGLSIVISLDRSLRVMLGPRRARLLTKGTAWLDASVAMYAVAPCLPFLVGLSTVAWAIGSWQVGRAAYASEGGAGSPLRSSAGVLMLATVMSAAGLSAAIWFWPTPPTTAPTPYLPVARLSIIATSCALPALAFVYSVWVTAALLAQLAQHLPDPVLVRRLRRVQEFAPLWAVGLGANLAIFTAGVMNASPLVSAPMGLLGLTSLVGWVAALLVLNAVSRLQITLREAL